MEFFHLFMGFYSEERGSKKKTKEISESLRERERERERVCVCVCFDIGGWNNKKII